MGTYVKMHQRSRSLVATGLLATANLLIPAAILIFAAGFFPYKPFLAGYAQYDETDQAPAAPFDRVVFMVVDALRRYAAHRRCATAY
jgi:ethanolamine phosphate transferase 2 subunit G